MKGKKGISPLIATVLLIVLVITIGAVIMTWVRSYTQGTIKTADDVSTTELSCNLDNAIEFSTFDGVPTVCYYAAMDGEGAVTALNGIFTFENKGSVDLTGYKIRYTTDIGVVEVPVTETVPVASIKRVQSADLLAEGTTVPGSSKIVQIEVLPKIRIAETGKEVYCTDSGIKTIAVASDCASVGLSYVEPTE